MSLSDFTAHTPTNASNHLPIAPSFVGQTRSTGQPDAANREMEQGELRNFVDRRRERGTQGTSERRQFGSSHEGLSDPGRELALAIDQYKMEHHRRYITCDEMLMVITRLGYSK